MKKHNIAIVGLGRVGSVFLNELLNENVSGVKVVAAVEKAETLAKAAAAQSHVKVLSLDELVAEGDKVDVVFDLSGGTNVAEELLGKYAAQGNLHTIVAPERMAHLMLTLMENQRSLPDVHPQR